MVPPLDTATLPHQTLALLYRFAWLLSGSGPAAEQALTTALAGAEAPLEETRNADARLAWLLQRVRQACLALSPPPEDDAVSAAPRLLREEALATPEILEIEAYIVAQRFHTLPEPARSALALFYLELLPLPESARLLSLSLEEYCAALGGARLQLHEHIGAPVA